MFGWRIAFFAVGIPGVLFAVVFFLTVREPQRGRWEVASARAHKPGFSETVNVLSSFKSFRYIALGAGLTAFAGYGNGNFAPSFLIRNHGFTVGEVGVLLAIAGGGGGMLRS